MIYLGFSLGEHICYIKHNKVYYVTDIISNSNTRIKLTIVCILIDKKYKFVWSCNCISLQNYKHKINYVPEINSIMCGKYFENSGKEITEKTFELKKYELGGMLFLFDHDEQKLDRILISLPLIRLSPNLISFPVHNISFAIYCMDQDDYYYAEDYIYSEKYLHTAVKVKLIYADKVFTHLNELYIFTKDITIYKAVPYKLKYLSNDLVCVLDKKDYLLIPIFHVPIEVVKFLFESK